MEQEEVERMYRKFYEKEFFVRYQAPTLAGVRGSQLLRPLRRGAGGAGRRGLGHRQPSEGASGQAIQNMNLMCGFDEKDGLRGAGVLRRRGGCDESP